MNVKSWLGLVSALLMPVCAVAQTAGWSESGGVTSTNNSVVVGSGSASAKLNVILPANAWAIHSNGWVTAAGGIYTQANTAAGLNSDGNGLLSFRSGGGDGRMVLTAGGYLGIGIANPGNLLHVGGIIRAEDRIEVRRGGSDAIAAGSGFFLGDAAGDWVGLQMSATKNLDFWTQSPGWSKRMTLTGAGNLGIGTTAEPVAKLEIVAAGTTARGFHTNGYATAGGGWYTDAAAAGGINGNVSGDLAFRAGGGDGRIFIKGSNGYVGVATNNPQATLDVNGSIRATSVIGAVYQDLAEWVPAIGEVAPGSVVIVAPDRTNSVLASAEEYDTRVAGVVSAQPGLLLGESGPSKVMVATIGRVKVKVDATRAPIAVGDLLVTSGKSGMAMKSQPVELGGVKLHRPGTLVGKALEPLASGTGEILVLLSLQ